MASNDGSKKALVISTSEYKFLEPLVFCRNDGEQMCQVLESLNYHISNNKLIGKVGADQMRKTMIEFFRSSTVKPDDTLLFYYSGHGLIDEFGDAYLAPFEIEPSAPDKEGILFDELTRLMNKSNSTKIVTILDCCYSGAARIGKGIEEENANLGRLAIDKASQKLRSGEGRCILAASQAYQKAFDTAEQNQSLYTYYLLKGLRGNEKAVDKTGCVTPDSLGKYVYNTIMSLPSDKRPNQKPVKKIEESGDIILAYYPQFDISKGKDITSDRIENEANLKSDQKESQIHNSTNLNNLDEIVKSYFLKKNRRFDLVECAEELGLSVTKVREIISRLGLVR
jgi:hypothetical protein